MPLISDCFFFHEKCQKQLRYILHIKRGHRTLYNHRISLSFSNDTVQYFQFTSLATKIKSLYQKAIWR